MDLDNGDRVIARVLESGRYGEGSNKPDSKKGKNKMKKLMIAAVAAIVAGGAFAACSYIEKKVVTTNDPAWAYKWTFTGKTTKAIDVKCDKTDYVTRTSTSLKIQGWSFYCDPVCGDFEAMEADEVFWSTKPAKITLDGGVTFEVANVIGKAGKNYEAFGVADFASDGAWLYTLYLAGFGTYDAKNDRVSSISGNFAGIAAAPRSADQKCTLGDVSKVWECCGCPTLEADSIAYGKWSIKYNKSMAKKYAAGEKDLYKKVYPSWVWKK